MKNKRLKEMAKKAGFELSVGDWIKEDLSTKLYAPQAKAGECSVELERLVKELLAMVNALCDQEIARVAALAEEEKESIQGWMAKGSEQTARRIKESLKKQWAEKG